MVVDMQKYISIEDAANEVGVSERTIRRWISSGQLSARRAGPRLLRIARADIDQFMSAAL